MLRSLFLLLSLSVFVPSAHAQTPAREFVRAESAWDKDEFAAAESHFDSALKLSTHNSGDQAHAYFGRGLARLQQEKWQSARDDLTASIELNPDNPEAFASRGMASKALGDYTSLLADAHRAAQIDPEYSTFEDDAKSTINWRRSKFGFLVLGCFVLLLGAVPLMRGIARVAQGERDAKRNDKSPG